MNYLQSHFHLRASRQRASVALCLSTGLENLFLPQPSHHSVIRIPTFNPHHNFRINQPGTASIFGVRKSPIYTSHAMKAKSMRKPVTAEQSQEYGTRLPVEQTNGAPAEPGEVIYELTGDVPLRNDDSGSHRYTSSVAFFACPTCSDWKQKEITAVFTGSVRPCSFVAPFAIAREEARPDEVFSGTSRLHRQSRARQDTHALLINPSYVFVLQDGTEVTLSRRQSGWSCASRAPFRTISAAALSSPPPRFLRSSSLSPLGALVLAELLSLSPLCHGPVPRPRSPSLSPVCPNRVSGSLL